MTSTLDSHGTIHAAGKRIRHRNTTRLSTLHGRASAPGDGRIKATDQHYNKLPPIARHNPRQTNALSVNSRSDFNGECACRRYLRRRHLKRKHDCLLGRSNRAGGSRCYCLQRLPSGWTAVLTDRRLTPDEIAFLKLRPGGVRQLKFRGVYNGK
jgi:hypothetical protein